jgi:hypothetical protein
MYRLPLRRAVLLAVSAGALLLAGCDNVVKAFNPNANPKGGGKGSGGTTTTSIQVVPVGGDAVNGRPTVKATFPKAGGWPVTVPIVVEFSESMNETSIRPTGGTGTDGKVFVRVKGTTQALPASYDFVLGGRVLIMRPQPALTNTANSSYEVVLQPTAMDCDGLKVTNTADTVLAEFTVDEATTVVNGKILTVLPRDTVRDIPRESDVVVVFTKPPNAATIAPVGQPANLQVRPTGGVALDGTITTPLREGTVGDPRVVQFTPSLGLPGDTQMEVVVNNSITFGTGSPVGVLDFGGRTPFSRFTTVPFAAPGTVHVGNPTPGFDDKINRNNLQNLTLAVGTPDSTQPGDVVLARIYGLDPTTSATGDVNFVERTAAASASGHQTVTVDFSGTLGTLTSPRFSEGQALFAVQMQRGSQHSGFVQSANSQGTVFDLTAPTLTSVGPPVVSGTNDLITDQESVVLYGQASEAIGAATLTDGVSTVALFAGSTDGHFVMKPITLGPLLAPRGWSLLLTDKSGNMAETAATGRFLQRGSLISPQTGTLDVEVYDEATLQAIAGATVVIDPGVPQIPASGRQTAVTDAAGVATFTVVSNQPYSITAVQTGYDLTTLYNSTVGHASLPLRPQSGATGNVGGQVNATFANGNTAIVGDNAFDDVLTQGALTNAPPSLLPPTPVRPSRLQLVTAYTGVFEPNSTPTFNGFACVMAGQTTLQSSPPLAPADPGGTSTFSFLATAIAPTVSGTFANLAAPFTKDFSQAVGLVTPLPAPPTVRVMGSFQGFCGQGLLSVGFATGGPSYQINASYSVTLTGLLADYVVGNIPFVGPAAILWVSTTAVDQFSNVSRHRGLLAPNGLIDLLPAPSIPTITAPAGPFTGQPQVTFVDRLDRAALPFSLAIGELIARDGLGHKWRVLYEDTDPQGATRTVQFPDQTGLTGLVPGTWNIQAEGRLFLATTMSAGNLLLEERRRGEVTFARSQSVPFTIQ